MSNLNDEIQEDTGVYLTITWGDIAQALLALLIEFVTAPFRSLYTRLKNIGSEDDTVELEPYRDITRLNDQN